MSTIAVVIPSWNTAAYLERCLDSLEMQAGADLDVIVVDNGSTDASIELVRRRDLRVVSLPSNIGFAGAVNLGAERTIAPLVLVLNADCFLEPDCVRILEAVLTADRRLGGVQPRIMQEADGVQPRRVYSTGQFLTRSGAAFERGWGEPDDSRDPIGCEVFGVSGAACLLRRELFTELDGYDSAYFAFFEDVDLNARARLAGWRFEYVPEAVAIHVGHAGWRQERQAQRFVVELTVRNRLATAFKVLPVRGIAGSLAQTLRSVAGSPFHRTTGAVLRGAATALTWLPRLLNERKRLRRGNTIGLDGWLATRRGPGPNPQDI